MIKSRKCQLVMVLILVCTCAPVLGQEPNETKTELKFEISSEKQVWIVEPMNQFGTGPIKPTHVAVLLMEPERIPIIHWNDISNSRVGQTMSQEQHDFLNQGQVRYIRHKEAYREFHWYAVREDDARKMPQAFLEAWTNKVNSKLQPLLKQQQELQEKIAEIKKQISKMEAEIKNSQPNLDRLKKEIQYLHSGKAEEAISEFNKMLNTLKIELSGIRSRLQTIEIYKAKLGKEISGEHRIKLEQMFIEQMIELKAGEARKNTVIDLRNEARSFYNLDRKLDKLKSTKYNLGNDLTRLEAVLGQIEEKLTNPSPDMLPPKVYQDKVTIYPVR